jgi:hypothetical protein
MTLFATVQKSGKAHFLAGLFRISVEQFFLYGSEPSITLYGGPNSFNGSACTHKYYIS